MALATESPQKPSNRAPSESDPSSPTTPQLSNLNNPSIEELEAKCAAYVRNDKYGTMGLGEVDWWEKVKLGIAVLTLVPLRMLLSMSILVLYYLICRACTLFKVPEGGEEAEDEQEDYAHMGGWRRAVVVWTGRFLSIAIFFVFGFYSIDIAAVYPKLDLKLADSNNDFLFLFWTDT